MELVIFLDWIIIIRNLGNKNNILNILYNRLAQEASYHYINLTFEFNDVKLNTLIAPHFKYILNNFIMLSKRAEHLLKVLVNRYIYEGQPIGSRTLSRDNNLNLSPATIRNVMADLEEMGLVCSPHTSAGRIPTVRGYRLFVDSLLQIKPLTGKEEQNLRQQFAIECDNQDLLEQTSNLLSNLTNLTGLVTLPKCCDKSLRHIEFLSLSKRRILVILVFNNAEVENRIIHTSRNYSPAELQNAANYLNTVCIGKDVKTLREELLNDLQMAQKDMDKLMQTVAEVTEKAFDDDENDDFVMTGQTNLMTFAELSNIEKLRDLFVVFNEKRDILHLLEQALKTRNMQIFIGEECGNKVFCDCTVITSPYVVEDKVIGVIGIIGPTRMHYERIIPIINLTAKLLGSALNPH